MSAALLRVKRTLAALVFLALSLQLPAQAPYAGPASAGRLEAPPRHETSGLAASRRNPGMLWTHDDSGGADSLYAVTTAGKRVGTLHLRGVKNDDWEDLATCELDGKAWLLIADTGDNDAVRPHVVLHFVEEPPLEQLSREKELRLRPARTLRVRYEDGPRDCEAVAIDAASRAVYLLTKRDEPPRLYRVELGPALVSTATESDTIAVARHVGTVPRLPPLTVAQQRTKGYQGRRRGEVTAMDFASDGSAAVVLTYGDLLVFPRRTGEAWADALARAPERSPAHNLAQAEAACFSPDGKQIYVASEDARTLLRYDRR